MRLVIRFVSAVGFATVIMATALVPQTAGATMAPHGSVVQVTGYSQVALTGSEGPVVIEVGGRKAAAIRRALAGLSATSSLPDCMEALNAFSISVLPRRGAPPLLTATEYDCPSPGVVRVHQDGVFRNLKEDCAFRNAVIAALPPGRAEGTRHDPFAHCSA